MAFSCKERVLKLSALNPFTRDRLELQVHDPEQRQDKLNVWVPTVTDAPRCAVACSGLLFLCSLSRSLAVLACVGLRSLSCAVSAVRWRRWYRACARGKPLVGCILTQAGVCLAVCLGADGRFQQRARYPRSVSRFALRFLLARSFSSCRGFECCACCVSVTRLIVSGDGCWCSSSSSGVNL